MADWKYNPEDYNPDSYTLIPPGEYRVRIEDADERVSQTGKTMFRLTLKVSGYNSLVWYYLVFDSTDEEARKRTNQRLGSIYDSFNIPKGNINPYDWKGKTGGAKIRNKPDNNNEMRAEVHYFLTRKKVDALPAWQEGSTGKPATAQVQDTGFGDFNPQPFDPDAHDSGLPF